ncbi:acyltransferase [Cohnella sp. WQ 127256]|uniref:acyltransferase family protein n=1 Tax=Cohnella sp. WQ 127256 TaxID=2938790 RepID=UPI002117316B|nr:acyltransferase [Cohnella sp. WQ 127256]
MKQIDTGFLNGTRFLFAIWVVIGHFFDYLGGSNNPYIDGIILNPDPAVNGFMIITGFLMTYQYILRSGVENPQDRKTFLLFWLRRLFRLYPIYLVCILAAYFLYKINSDFISDNFLYVTGNAYESNAPYNDPPTLWGLFGHLTFIHGFIPGMNISILNPAWSLGTEMQFYMIFPFLFLFLFKSEWLVNSRISFLLILSVLLERVSLKAMGVWDEGMFLTFGSPSLITYKLNFFILGVIMASVALNKMSKWHLGIALLLIVSFQDFVTSLIIIMLVGLLFSNEGKAYIHPSIHKLIAAGKSMLSIRLATFGADVSYSLYLSHMILFPAIVAYFIQLHLESKSLTIMLAFTVFMMINILLSYLLYLCIEKPMITLGKQAVKGLSRAWSKPNATQKRVTKTIEGSVGES